MENSGISEKTSHLRKEVMTPVTRFNYLGTENVTTKLHPSKAKKASFTARNRHYRDG